MNSADVLSRFGVVSGPMFEAKSRRRRRAARKNVFIEFYEDSLKLRVNRPCSDVEGPAPCVVCLTDLEIGLPIKIREWIVGQELLDLATGESRLP